MDEMTVNEQETPNISLEGSTGVFLAWLEFGLKQERLKCSFSLEIRLHLSSDRLRDKVRQYLVK